MTTDDIEQHLAEIAASVPQADWDAMVMSDVREAVSSLSGLLGCCDDSIFHADPEPLRKALYKFIEDDKEPRDGIGEG